LEKIATLYTPLCLVTALYNNMSSEELQEKSKSRKYFWRRRGVLPSQRPVCAERTV
jgi:hypothetical protein